MVSCSIVSLKRINVNFKLEENSVVELLEGQIELMMAVSYLKTKDSRLLCKPWSFGCVKILCECTGQREKKIGEAV
jgi:hypothetical protein